MDSFFPIFLSQPAREWITLSLKICLFLSKEKPRMFLVPNEEISSVSYGYEVNVRCTASGFPRPTIMLLVNQLSAYKVEGTHLFMLPYEANMTFVVKMTSDVECHVSNRLESSFLRMRINLKGLFWTACSDCIALSFFLRDRAKVGKTRNSITLHSRDVLLQAVYGVFYIVGPNVSWRKLVVGCWPIYIAEFPFFLSK